MTLIGTQVDSDRRLLEFKNYEEYLDSLVTAGDFCHLRSTKLVRELAELGYRCAGETLDRNAFYRRLKAVKDLLFPIRRPYELTSEYITPCDAVTQELALRERPNRLRILSTIIFVRYQTKKQFEISGYIDFSERLKTENWIPYFQGRKKITPKISDLAYYHWRTGKSYLNESSNYEPIVEPKKGLLFKNVHDRRIIIVDPAAPSAGTNTSRIRLYSPNYIHIIFYDHLLQNPN